MFTEALVESLSGHRGGIVTAEQLGQAEELEPMEAA